MAPWLWRLAFTLFTFYGGAGLLVYLLFWIFVPAEPLTGHVPRQLGA
jgi:phage shock protein PspC (stress-responsive transcriptional regulator)